MARVRRCGAAALLYAAAALLLAAAAGATHDPRHRASGDWVMSFPDNDPAIQSGSAKTGALHLRAVSKEAGKQEAAKFKYGAFLSECGSTADDFYIGTFRRDPDTGPLVGCVHKVSGIFSAVWRSNKYGVEGGFQGVLGGPVAASPFPSRPSNVFATSFRGHFPGDGAATDPSGLGVGIVPHLDAGDPTEQWLYRIVGQLPEIDRVYTADDSVHLFTTLLKLRKAGKKIRYLVIAGHGSRDVPGIKFGRDDMVAQEVDLQWNKQQLAIAQQLLKNPNASVKPQSLQKRIHELQTQIAFLQSAADVMAKDAIVLLVNCSAAATPAGQKFVRDFGDVLLGKNGGHIIASRKDVRLKVSNYLAQWWRQLRDGIEQEKGGTIVEGDWVTFRIR